MGTDLDIPATVDGIDDLRSTLAEHFKPTDCDVRTQNGDVVVDMKYRGFEDFETAAEHVFEHASLFESAPGCDDVHFTVDTRGVYDDSDGERDDRPSGRLTATVTPSPTAID